MRRPLKLLLWTGVFVACAGVGAIIAASSNPFPPAVSGDVPTSSSPPPSQSAQALETWQLKVTSSTKHKLYVGGGCRTRWGGKIELSVFEGGVVKGSGPEKLIGKRRCTFPNAQLQLKTIEVSAAGTKSGRAFKFELRQQSGLPEGARDYGGFAGAVLSTPLRLRARDGTTRLKLHRLDATGRGSYYSTTDFTLECVSGC